MWSFVPQATVAAALGFVIAGIGGPARADPTGSLFEYIEGTGLIDAVLHPVAVGLEPSPQVEGNEMGDALAEFSDKNAAIRQLENLKAQKGVRGGKVFAAFLLGGRRSDDGAGMLNLRCGISSSSSNAWSEIQSAQTDGFFYGGLGWFHNFKIAGRSSRVRAIARCLAQLPGMPSLRPSLRKIRGLSIDESSYQLGETWFKTCQGANPKSAAPEQYKKAFSCLVTAAAEQIPQATEDWVIMRSFVEEQTAYRPPTKFSLSDQGKIEDVPLGRVVLAVTHQSAVNSMWNSRRLDAYFGMWPTAHADWGQALGSHSQSIEVGTNPMMRTLLMAFRGPESATYNPFLLPTDDILGAAKKLTEVSQQCAKMAGLLPNDGSCADLGIIIPEKPKPKPAYGVRSAPQIDPNVCEPCRNAKNIEELLEKIRGADRQVKIIALLNLGFELKRDSSAPEELLQALQDSSPEIRRMALRAVSISKIRDPKITPLIQALKKDTDPIIAGLASLTLDVISR